MLLSLEIAYIHQHRGEASIGKSPWERGPAEVLQCGLDLYLTVAQEFSRGAKPPSTTFLAARIGIKEREALRLIEKFKTANLLIAAGEKEIGYVPARELSTIKTEEITRCVLGTVTKHQDLNSLSERLYNTIVEGALGSIKGSSIKDIIASKEITPPGPVDPRENVKEDENSSNREKSGWLRRYFK